MTLLGPWSAYELPPYLRRQELERLLTGYEMFSEGKVRASGRVLSTEERDQISNLIRYLSKTPQKKEIVRWLKEPLAADSAHYKVQNSLLAEMKLTDPSKVMATKSFNYFRNQSELLIPVRGFSYVMDIQHLPPEYKIATEGTKVVLRQEGKAIATFELKEAIAKLDKMDGIHFDDTVVIEGTGTRKAQLRLYWVTGHIKKELLSLGTLKGSILLSD